MDVSDEWNGQERIEKRLVEQSEDIPDTELHLDLSCDLRVFLDFPTVYRKHYSPR
jgi:hypothetical protein